MSPLHVAIMRKKPELVKILLDGGAKLILKTKNKEVEEEMKNIDDRINIEIEKHHKWMRLKHFLKFYKNKEKSKYYPKEFYNLNPLIMRNLISEYM